MPGISPSSTSTTGRKLFEPHERPSGDPVSFESVSMPSSDNRVMIYACLIT